MGFVIFIMECHLVANKEEMKELVPYDFEPAEWFVSGKTFYLIYKN
jgi:hypothetical protein